MALKWSRTSCTIILALLVLASCDGLTSSPTASPLSPIETPGTPEQVNVTDDPIVPTPAADSGVVVGRLLASAENMSPYLAKLYLGEIIHANTSSSSPPMISFSEGDSLEGVQNESTGRFYFAQVPPGEYAIVLWTPLFSMPLENRESQSELIFEVSAGEVTDLGDLVVP